MNRRSGGRADAGAVGDPPVERLLPGDLMMLWPEDRGWREDIGAVALLGAPAPPRPPLDPERVRRVVAARVGLVPRLRQVLHRPPPGLGGPYWVDDPGFDVDRHVGLAPLPDGVDESALLAEVERLRRRPFDPQHPRWEMWLLPGLADGGTGLYLKLHHAVADGMAGIALIGAFLDADPDAPAGEPAPWQPRSAPTEPQLRADLDRHRASTVRELADEARHPVRTVRRTWASAAGLAHLSRHRAPRTSLNRPIGADRRLTVVRLDLDAVRDVAHRHRATVNDVLLALTAAGIRALLRHRGEAVEDLVLNAMVPVSLHGGDAGAAEGNQDGSMLVPLSLGTCTPGARIEGVAGATRRAKRAVFVPPSGVLARTERMQRLTWRRFERQRWANAYVVDLPGPAAPLHLAGAPLLEVFPLVPLVGNITLGVGALSLSGRLGVAVVSDVDTCPDVDRFTAGLLAAAHDLGLEAVDRG